MPSLNNTASVLLIGVGNEFRSDDGVGILAARKIKERNLPGVTAVEQSGEGTALMDAWANADAVILVDAVSSGVALGTIHRIDARNKVMPKDFLPFSTHAFGVAQAVELARRMNSLPAKLIIYGIEGKNFDSGVSLSPEVQAALDEVMRLVISENFSFVDDV